MFLDRRSGDEAKVSCQLAHAAMAADGEVFDQQHDPGPIAAPGPVR